MGSKNLMINIGRTVAMMSYHTKQSRFPLRPTISYRITDIANKSDTEFLGVHITENMKWTTRICVLRLQLSKVCYIIKSVQGIVGLGMIRSFYHSKYESLVRYSIIFWGGQIMKVYLYLSYRRGDPEYVWCWDRYILYTII